MRSIAVINQKGGVGKTTTAVNLGAALAERGHSVLLVDIDPQANLTMHLDIDPSGLEHSIYDVLSGQARLEEVVVARGNLDVIPSHIDLAGAEVELVGVVGRETILREAIQELLRGDPSRPDSARSYDFLIIDCPPSLGLLSLNALTSVEEVMIAMQTEFFALQGMTKLMSVVELVRTRLNPKLRLSSIVPCRYDPRTNLAKEVLEEMKRFFGDLVTRTCIRSNVRLAEAPSHGKTVFEYDPDAKGSSDYRRLAREILGEPLDEPEATPAPDEAKSAEARFVADSDEPEPRRPVFEEIADSEASAPAMSPELPSTNPSPDRSDPGGSPEAVPDAEGSARVPEERRVSGDEEGRGSG
jgi:chromosome partitioning protein